MRPADRPPGRPAVRGAVLTALASAVLAALVAAAPARAERLQALNPGQEVPLAGCLRVSVLDFTDRWGPLDPADWVTLRLVNHCSVPVRHLLADLLILDASGRTYGAPVWLLERGEILWPGQVKTGRFPVPDGADYLPRHWAVRVRALQWPSAPPGATVPTGHGPAAAVRPAPSAPPRAAVRTPARRAPPPVARRAPPAPARTAPRTARRTTPQPWWK